MKNSSFSKNLAIFCLILIALWFSGLFLSLVGALFTGIVAGFFGILKLLFSKFGIAIIAAALIVYIINNRDNRQPNWH